jgi:hypothetical protein
MDTLRISVTDIDRLRWFRQDEDAELSTFLADMRRETPPTEAMMAGTALHKALETAALGDHKGFRQDGYTFSFETDAELDLPAIREIKATGEFVVDGCVVTLVGKVDAVHGGRVDDHKLTGRYDPERFLGSHQWRCYLLLLGADLFRWNVFEATESSPKNYLVKHIHQLTMHRYPGMRDDVIRELGWFVQFARAYLPERIGKAAA